MTNWKFFLQGTAFRYIDHSHPDSLETPMASFAVDDALAISVGNNESPPVVRLWVHDQTIVLGIADAKLPNRSEAVHYLEEKGYQAIVRNSGGLAVVLDQGVLNFSLILPDVKKIGIHEGYEAMVGFVQAIFSDLTDEIEAFEVVGSYCPGDYDLSIGGRKFAGISQRRVKNGTAVQIYLCVEGDGEERAKLIQRFYEIGVLGELGNFSYPTIQPETMASLSQLLGQEITMEEVKERIFNKLLEAYPSVKMGGWSEQEEIDFQKRLKQMIERNEKVFGNS